MAEEWFGRLDIKAPVGAVLVEEGDFAAAVDVSGDEMAAHPVGRQEAGLDVDGRAWAQVAEVGQA